VRLYAALVALAAAAAFASLSVGAADLGEEALRQTLLSLRGARLVGASLAGAALAAGGVLVQGLFRNPLASPSILGTTAGAALGGQLALLLVQGLGLGIGFSPEMALPLGCLAGAGLSLLILLVFLRATDDLLALLLTGFILGSLFLSLGGFITSLAQDDWQLGRAVVAFSLGGLGGVGWGQVLAALPLFAVGLVAAWGWGRPLDLLLAGEDEARTLGVDVRVVRTWTAVWVSALVAAAVALGGNVAFVGLIVPHALRPFAGVAHRRLLPAAALAGAVFVAGCDVLARAIPSRGEVPLGVVTGLVGAPIFLWLLIRARREERGDV
ncbi:MAG TPA: iron chelate uptake ABC transporter family permease subunit, partial [Polyangiaceae bacterium LLY-WYZ-15_(1-7)]|nr:iron chelate uptake ABC transporter family permease subunit [Polyangiaceae bacterium LLY-WYZ-15_(1-7)]